MQGEIESAAFTWQQEVERGNRVIVGVNEFVAETEAPIELHAIDPAGEQTPARANRARSRRA